MMKHLLRCCLPLILALTACQSPPPSPGMKLGKPYNVEGRTYYPSYDPTYDKIGVASWYGPGFHGKYTASGEIYNQNDLTAAHPTLPMPSFVRVTNLGNGRSLIVRINDRGPFKSNRIIDLSKKAAQELGIRSTAQVRVQYLKLETEAYLDTVQKGGAKNIDMFAYNSDSAGGKNIPAHAESDQIVEASVSTTHTGQTVTDAAPIMTVKSDDLNQTSAPEPAVAQEVKLVANDTHPPRFGGGLVKQAWADENIPVSTSESPEKYGAHSIESNDLASTPPAVKETPAVETPVEKPVEKPVKTEKTKVSVAHVAVAKSKLAPAAAPVEKTGAYYIQAGSFAAEENAKKLSAKLEGIAPIDTGTIEVSGKTLWRVRLGPFSEAQAAHDALEKVRAAGSPDARVVHP